MTANWAALFGDFNAALYPAYRESMAEAGTEAGFDHYYGPILMRVLSAEPDALPAELAMQPYYSPARTTQVLSDMVERGFLEGAGDAGYRATQKGRESVLKVFRTAQKHIGAVSPMPEAKLVRVHTLLSKVAAAALELPQPPSKRYMRSSMVVTPPSDAPLLARVDQLITDLTAFRDDCHIGAWGPHGVSGQVWETLSYVWEGSASSVETLWAHDGIQARGYTEADYDRAFDELVAKGWLDHKDGTYAITERGQKLRDEVERLTDAYHYAAWACLDAGETAELADLLVALADGLKAALEQPA